MICKYVRISDGCEVRNENSFTRVAVLASQGSPSDDGQLSRVMEFSISTALGD